MHTQTHLPIANRADLFAGDARGGIALVDQAAGRIALHQLATCRGGEGRGGVVLMGRENGVVWFPRGLSCCCIQGQGVGAGHGCICEMQGWLQGGSR